MPTPKVSVYILNHNYGCFITKAIDSVLNQTFQDFEVLIIDDGSTDNSRDIIEQYRTAPQVNIVYQQNRGLSVSNNIALRLARGEYIMRLDADDFLDPHALEILVGHLDRHPETSLVFPDYWLVNAEGAVQEIVRRHDFNQVSVHDQPAHGACTMMRRETLLQLGGYDEAFPRQDGYFIWLKMIQRHQVSNVNLPLFYYRQHGPSLSSNETKILEVRGNILRKFADEVPSDGAALAIIPVRGDERAGDLPPLRMLGSKPLIDWTIDAALESTRIFHVIVSSPREDVLQHVARRNDPRVQTRHRPHELSHANTGIEGTVRDVLDNCTSTLPRVELVTVLYIEAPFRNGKTIDDAINTLRVYGVDSLVTVRPETDIFYRHQGHGLEQVRRTSSLRLEREELFREAGRVYITKRQAFEQTGQIISGRIGHAVVTERQGWRLRRESDWYQAEYLALPFESISSSEVIARRNILASQPSRL